MKYTPIFADGASGSVGSLVASRNRSGPYFRRRAIPVNPNTIRQQAVRSIFATLVNLWTSTLTASQRTAWDTYAANTPLVDGLGAPAYVTGQNQYVRSNVPRLQYFGTRVDDAPTMFNLGEPPTSIVVTTLGTLDALGVNMAGDALSTTIGISGGASDDGDMVLSIGAPINPSRTFSKGPYQVAATAAITATDTEEAFSTMFTALTSDNGDPTAGEVRPVRIRNVYDDGRLSQELKALVPVVAETA